MHKTLTNLTKPLAAEKSLCNLIYLDNGLILQGKRYWPALFFVLLLLLWYFSDFQVEAKEQPVFFFKQMARKAFVYGVCGMKLDHFDHVLCTG